MAAPTFALRPLLPSDVPILAALFRASILELAQDDYSENQLDAWSGCADDEAAFGQTLSKALTLVATEGGKPVGFASLEGKEKISMLYVAPDKARQGVATLLCDALVKLATARGATKLTVDASDTARDFFAARQFQPMMRNMVPIEAEWLGNTTMERKLAAATPDAGLLQ